MRMSEIYTLIQLHIQRPTCLGGNESGYLDSHGVIAAQALLRRSGGSVATVKTDHKILFSEVVNLYFSLPACGLLALTFSLIA